MFSTFVSYAQQQKGSFAMDVNYGYSIIQNISLNYKEAIQETSRTTSGPFLVRGEYFLSDRFSVGGELNYRKSETSFEFDGKVDTLFESLAFRTSQFRLMAIGNFYIVNNPKFDWYLGLSIGYVNRSIRLKNVVTGVYPEYTQYFDWSFGGFDLISFIDFPLASRLQMGMRYRLTPAIGLNFQAGAGGGSFVNGGLSLMF